MQKDPVKESVSRLIEQAVTALKQEFPALDMDAVRMHLEIPKERQYGDLFTNVAMKISGFIGQKPLACAVKLCSILESEMEKTDAGRNIRKIEVKPPGFINFHLADKVFYDTLVNIAALKTRFGENDSGNGKKVLLEFVSANPTGPLTIAHARQAAFGDSLANILEFCGYKVTREYYINDEGVQMSILAESVRSRYLELLKRETVFPENGYKGAYIYDIAGQIQEQYKDKYADPKDHAKEFFLGYSCKNIMDTIRRDLDDFQVRFDSWFSQAALAKSGKVEQAMEFLKTKGYIYESEGASWFKSTEFGDDKDRVVKKSDGTYTYLTPDIAYHRDKFARGFDKLIDMWGPDHHGYIPRMKAAIQALGHEKDALSVIIIQLATLFRDGKPVSMSTRQGEFVTLRELLDEVGKDAGRFFFCMRKSDSHLDFDLEVAKKQSSQNPVYYVQYAHARICSILEKENAQAADIKKLELLKEKEEIDLIKLLWEYPNIILQCGSTLEPHSLTAYLQELARMFHGFYDKHKVIGDDAELTRARISLVNCTRIILSNGLTLLGVSAPKKM